MATLVKRPLFIGRTRQCDFRIRHKSISRRHCTVNMSVDGRIFMVDDHSKNGLQVARRGHCGEYQALKWHVLEVGDLLRLGDIRLIVVDQRGNCPIQVNKCADLVRFALQIYGTDERACDCLNFSSDLWRALRKQLKAKS